MPPPSAWSPPQRFPLTVESMRVIAPFEKDPPAVLKMPPPDESGMLLSLTDELVIVAVPTL